MFGIEIKRIEGTSEFVAVNKSPLVAKVHSRWKQQVPSLSRSTWFGLFIGVYGIVYQLQVRGEKKRLRIVSAISGYTNWRILGA